MLSDALKILLATAYAFSIKTQQFHWNITGDNFPQYHKFLDELYSEVYDNTIDRTAELIRQLDAYAPGSFQRFSELSKIQDQILVPKPNLMFEELYNDNQILLNLWKESFHIANSEDQQGIANYIAERIDAHGKWGWQLRSILKNNSKGQNNES